MDELLNNIYNLDDYYDNDESDFIKNTKLKNSYNFDDEVYEPEENSDDLLKPKKKRKRRTKEEIEKEKHYFDDVKVTKTLMRDIKNGKISEELGEIFMKIQEKILTKPNFSGYYGGIRENMISNGVFVFLKNWSKFKPYRVKNNYVKQGEIKVTKDSIHKGKVIYVDKNLKKYDMIEIMNKTYTVYSSEKYKNGYKIHLFNKLKCDIPENIKGFYYYPKFKIIHKNNEDEFEGEIKGGFTLLSMFAFTAAKNEITANKKNNDKIKEHLDSINHNVIDNLYYDSNNNIF